jgi:inorganic phosphate transporter, PiT family
MELVLIAGAAFLALSNGANDNFKGFATVWGSQTLSYRRALILATIATVLGSLASLYLAESLVQHFSGKGLVPDDIAGHASFVASAGLGAAVTVIAATRLGLPISTTHALIGGLVGAGLALNGGAVNLANLGGTFLLPLLVSPFIAAMLGASAYNVMRRTRVENDCACVVDETFSIETDRSHAMARRAMVPRVMVASNEQCDRLEVPAARIEISMVLDRLHTLSAAMICFARGVNDTPKLAALLLAAKALDAQASIVIVAAMMALGGLLFARRVARTMSQQIVTMDHAQGLSANLIAAGLILFASKFGMPVSTTHVTVGSIVGVGVGGRSIDWNTTKNVLLSWVATLPIAATAAFAIGRML